MTWEEQRKFDCLVARHVMGYSDIRFSESDGELRGKSNRIMGGYSKVPRFSRDIEAAWQVVTKMRAAGRHFLLLATLESGLSIASFYFGPHDRSDLSATEPFDETPLAICRAALKALEVKEV
jgi:Phage ABA sandwich domain